MISRMPKMRSIFVHELKTSEEKQKRTIFKIKSKAKRLFD